MSAVALSSDPLAVPEASRAERDPDLIVELLLEGATRLEERGALREARGVLATILDIHPTHAQAILQSARVAKHLGDVEAAEESLGRLLELRPDDTEATLARFLQRMERGEIAGSLGDVEEAMCRDVDVGERLFECCVALLGHLEALESQPGATIRVGPGWPVVVSDRFVEDVKALYFFLPSVFNSTRFTDRYFVNQAKFMQYNGARLEKLLETVVSQVSFSRGARVFDAGCGNGWVLQKLVERFAVVPFAQDNSSTLRAIVEASVPGVDFQVGEITAIARASASFDVVLCTDVLEHVDRPEAALAELVRVARPGGSVFLSVPDGRRDAGSGHVNFFAPEGLRRLCASYPTEPIRIHPGGLSVVIRPDRSASEGRGV
ncbi:MAG: methyltransferase domain-containing protein [Deltaproteobacteria bacterium]|nr:methyltransferase domain-containing protein [Deltaproteobacteria bacterium]